jgi:uncharacterized protein (DUF1499 family)
MSKNIVVSTVSLLLFIVLAVFGIRLMSERALPSHSLGVTTSKSLESCGNEPNCVTHHDLETWKIIGDSSTIQRRITEYMSSLPRTELVHQEGNYLHFTHRSLVFNYIDDTEILIKPDQIEFRAAARSGYYDFGVNQRRMQDIIDNV